MPGLTLGSFAGGVAQGASQGADLRQKQQAIQENKMKLQQAIAAQQGAAANLKALLQPDGGAAPTGQPPIPGATPMAPGAMGAQAPTPLGQPSPALTQGPQSSAPPPQAAAPPPQQGPAPGGPPPPQGGMMQTPMPGATPMAPPQGGGASPPAVGGAASTAPDDGMSGVASPSGSFADNMNKTLKSIATDIQRANPGASPQAIVAAMSQRIDQMKGLQGDERAVLQYQAAMAKMQLQHTEDREKIQSAQQIAERNDQRIRDLNEANDKLKAALAAHHDQTLKQVAGTRAGATTGAASIRAGAQRDVAGTNLRAREYSADKGVEGKNVQAQAMRDVAATGERGKVRAATINTGGTDPGGPGGAQNPVSVKTPQDAQKLPKGTYFKRPDGTVMVRQ